MTAGWVRKSRAGTWGPWHRWNGHLTLCGQRMKGLAHHVTAQPEGDACAACERHAAAGTSRPYRR